MKIAILYSKASLYSTSRLKEAGQERGHEMQVVDYRRCIMNITSHSPSVIFQGDPLEGFDAIIQRIAASYTFYGTAVVRQFEMMGVFPVNESVAISRSRDSCVRYNFWRAMASVCPSRVLRAIPKTRRELST